MAPPIREISKLDKDDLLQVARAMFQILKNYAFFAKKDMGEGEDRKPYVLIALGASSYNEPIYVGTSPATLLCSHDAEAIEVAMAQTYIKRVDEVEELGD